MHIREGELQQLPAKAVVIKKSVENSFVALHVHLKSQSDVELSYQNVYSILQGGQQFNAN